MSDFDNLSSRLAARRATTEKMQLGVQMAAAAYAWQRSQQILSECGGDMSGAMLVDVLCEESNAAEEAWEAAMGTSSTAGPAQ